MALDQQAAEAVLAQDLNLRINAASLAALGLAGISAEAVKAIVAMTLAAQKEAIAKPPPCKVDNYSINLNYTFELYLSPCLL